MKHFLSLLLVALLLPRGLALSPRAAKYKACQQVLQAQVPTPDPFATVPSPDTGETDPPPAVAKPTPEQIAQAEDKVYERLAAAMTDTMVQDFCNKANSGVIAQSVSLQSPNQVVAAVARAESKVNKRKGRGAGVRAANVNEPDLTYTSVFDTAYTKDPTSGLYEPHDPEPDTTNSDWTNLYDSLKGANVVPRDASNRDEPPNKKEWFDAIVTCAIFDVLGSIAEATCDVFNVDDIEFIPRAVCVGIQLALLLSFESCEWVKMEAEMIDDYLDGQTAEAAYQNGIMAMQNQLKLYDQTKQVFDGLTADLEKYTNSLLARQCKAENDVANVQREANYLRRLMLTPEDLRPGWACVGKTTATTAKCIEPCVPRTLSSTGCVASMSTSILNTNLYTPQTTVSTLYC